MWSSRCLRKSAQSVGRVEDLCYGMVLSSKLGVRASSSSRFPGHRNQVPLYITKRLRCASALICSSRYSVEYIGSISLFPIGLPHKLLKLNHVDVDHHIKDFFATQGSLPSWCEENASIVLSSPTPNAAQSARIKRFCGILTPMYRLTSGIFNSSARGAVFLPYIFSGSGGTGALEKRPQELTQMAAQRCNVKTGRLSPRDAAAELPLKPLAPRGATLSGYTLCDGRHKHELTALQNKEHTDRSDGCLAVGRHNYRHQWAEMHGKAPFSCFSSEDRRHQGKKNRVPCGLAE